MRPNWANWPITSEPPAGMKRGNAAGEGRIGDALETRLPHHLGEIVRRREFSDAFNEIAIGVLIAGDMLADLRDHLEGIGVVDLVEHGDIDLGKLQTEEASAGRQNAPRL